MASPLLSIGAGVLDLLGVGDDVEAAAELAAARMQRDVAMGVAAVAILLLLVKR